MPYVTEPSAVARHHAEKRLAALAMPPGALGQLGELAIWIAACQGQVPPRPIGDVRLVQFGESRDISSSAGAVLARQHGARIENWTAAPEPVEADPARAASYWAAGASFARKLFSDGAELILLTGETDLVEDDRTVQCVAGFALACAQDGVPVVLDSSIGPVAALTAEKQESGAARWFAAGQAATHGPSADALALLADLNLGLVEPIIGDRLLREGAAVLLVLPLINAAIALLNGVVFLDDVPPGSAGLAMQADRGARR